MGSLSKAPVICRSDGMLKLTECNRYASACNRQAGKVLIVHLITTIILNRAELDRAEH
jgi:hypothetical protein